MDLTAVRFLVVIWITTDSMQTSITCQMDHPPHLCSFSTSFSLMVIAHHAVIRTCQLGAT
jgi:hypothetical protein